MFATLLLWLKGILSSPFKWLEDVLNPLGGKSSKRTVMVLSAMVLCVCLVAMTGAIIWVLVKNPKDHKIDGNIVLLYTSLTVPIAGLAGSVYIGKKDPNTPDKPINKQETLQG